MGRGLGSVGLSGGKVKKTKTNCIEKEKNI